MPVLGGAVEPPGARVGGGGSRIGLIAPVRNGVVRASASPRSRVVGPFGSLIWLHPAHARPYTGTMAPVVTLFAGDARKAIVAAISPGFGHLS